MNVKQGIFMSLIGIASIAIGILLFDGNASEGRNVFPLVCIIGGLIIVMYLIFVAITAFWDYLGEH
jgi:hypothetical protein